jgi:heme-degrading monooxygenase HmoA
MVVVIFTAKVSADADLKEYGRQARRMFELVQHSPGFISLTTSTGSNGEEVIIARFASEEAVAAWRIHPEHLQAQQLGRSSIYESYRVEVCTTIRDYEFRQESGITHRAL